MLLCIQGEEKVFCTCSFSSSYGGNKKDYDNFLALYPKIKTKLKKDVYYPLACLDAVEAYRELGTMVAKSTNEKKITKIQGTLTFTKGIYTGELQNNKMQGVGVFKWHDGAIYKGEFQNNEIHGLGEMIYKSGKKYIGEYKFGKADGFGTSIELNGKTSAGLWKNGKFLGKKKTSNNKNETIKYCKNRSTGKTFTVTTRCSPYSTITKEIYLKLNNKTELTKKINSEKKEEKEIKKISNRTSNSLDEKGYADCILENMKDVSSDEAALAIKEACTYKYLSENTNSNVVSSSNKNNSTYSNNTIGIVSLPTNLSSCGSITTTRFPIFTGC